MTSIGRASQGAKSTPSAVLFMLALEAGLVICWSAGFVGTRFAVAEAPMFRVLLWRSLMSGLILLPFALLRGPRLTLKIVSAHAFFGSLSMAAYLASFALALAQGVPTGLVALVSDMLPLAVALLSWPLLGERLNARQWFGTALGLLGVLIASGASIRFGDVSLWSYALPVFGTVCFALATLLQKKSTVAHIPVYQSLAIQCLTAAMIFAVFAWFEGGVRPIVTVHFVGGILWLVLVATFGAWSLYFMALKTSSPARVTAILYTSPPVTMIWAWLMFGEPLSLSMALGLAVSLAGIALIARKDQ